MTNFESKLKEAVDENWKTESPKYQTGNSELTWCYKQTLAHGFESGAQWALKELSSVDDHEAINVIHHTYGNSWSVISDDELKQAINPYYHENSHRFFPEEALQAANAKILLLEKEAEIHRETMKMQINVNRELSKDNEVLKKALEKFITKSNGLSFYVREPTQLKDIERIGKMDLIDRLEDLYQHQCEVESTLSTLTKSKGNVR